MQSLPQDFDDYTVCVQLRLRFLRRYGTNVSSYYAVVVRSLYGSSEYCSQNTFLSLTADCTYDHFQSNSDCPSCGRQLGQNDFLELVVSNPSAASQETLKNTFQTIFTKFSSQATTVSHREMCVRILKSMDDSRRAIKFLMKQFVHSTSAEGQRSGNLGNECAQLQQEIARLKQASNSERITYEQAVNDLKTRVEGMNGNIQGLQRQVQQQQLTIRERETQIRERDTQVAQFREMFAAEGQARVPSSRGSTGSSHSGGGGRRGRGPVIGHSQQQGGGVPPMQGFVQQREVDKRNALQKLSRSSPMVNHSSPSSGGGGILPMASLGITPIQIPRSNRGTTNTAPSLFARGGDLSAGPPTPRIRDFTVGGYQFTSGNSSSAGSRAKRPRMSQSGGGGQHQQRYQNGIPGFGRR